MVLIMIFKRKFFILLIFVGLILAGMIVGLYYYQHNLSPAVHSVLATSSPSIKYSVTANHQSNPNAYGLLKDAIHTLAKSKQFNDFIKADQLLQQHLKRLTLAQRYEVMESFLQAVNQHISLVDGEKKELSRHNDFLLDVTPEEYQPPLLAKRLLTVLQPEQKKWFSQAINHNFDLLDIGEGFYIIRLNPDYIVKRFAPTLPQADQVFIKAIAQQNQQQFYYDAAIAISWQELGERAIFWENYTKQYPDAYFAKDAQTLAAYYLYFFIHGMDNTRPIEYFNEQENAPVFNDDAKQAFIMIKNLYPTSNISQKIKQYESSMLRDQRIIESVEPTKRSILMGQL